MQYSLAKLVIFSKSFSRKIFQKFSFKKLKPLKFGVVRSFFTETASSFENDPNKLFTKYGWTAAQPSPQQVATSFAHGRVGSFVFISVFNVCSDCGQTLGRSQY